MGLKKVQKETGVLSYTEAISTGGYEAAFTLTQVRVPVPMYRWVCLIMHQTTELYWTVGSEIITLKEKWTSVMDPI